MILHESIYMDDTILCCHTKLLCTNKIHYLECFLTKKLQYTSSTNACLIQLIFYVLQIIVAKSNVQREK
jgi:hypothetical protein